MRGKQNQRHGSVHVVPVVLAVQDAAVERDDGSEQTIRLQSMLSLVRVRVRDEVQHEARLEEPDDEVPAHPRRVAKSDDERREEKFAGEDDRLPPPRAREVVSFEENSDAISHPE